MIVFISAADTELLSLGGAIRQLPAAFPAVRAFLSTRLQTDSELDAMLAHRGADLRGTRARRPVLFYKNLLLADFGRLADIEANMRG